MTEEVLVVEDEANIRELVSYTLMGAGYRVRSVADGESALREARGSRPDLVILDIRLPGMDGWEVCRRIREDSNVPIVILTALTEDESLVKGLRLGADDYVAKPFSPVVLTARVQALLRRAGPGAAQRGVTLGDLTIDPASAEVRRGERVLHLTPAEFRLLSVLLRRPGQVIGSSELMRFVQGRPVAAREANQLAKVHILHLRRKIEPDVQKPRYVLTVRGMGYMLNRHELKDDRE